MNNPLHDAINKKHNDDCIRISKKLQEYDIFHLFLEMNPVIKEQYNVYKTYEILKDDNGT